MIFGDIAYPCLCNLITPFKDNGRLTRQQINFNKTLSSCPYVIEHCSVLHNLAIDDEFQIIVEKEDEISNADDIQLADQNAEGDIPEGTTYRNYLMNGMCP